MIKFRKAVKPDPKQDKPTTPEISKELQRSLDELDKLLEETMQIQRVRARFRFAMEEARDGGHKEIDYGC